MTCTIQVSRDARGCALWTAEAELELKHNNLSSPWSTLWYDKRCEDRGVELRQHAAQLLLGFDLQLDQAITVTVRHASTLRGPGRERPPTEPS